MDVSAYVEDTREVFSDVRQIWSASMKLRISFLITQMTSWHLDTESIPLQDFVFLWIYRRISSIVMWICCFWSQTPRDFVFLKWCARVRSSHIFFVFFFRFFFLTFFPFENLLDRFPAKISSPSVYFHRSFNTDICWDLDSQFKYSKVFTDQEVFFFLMQDTDDHQRIINCKENIQSQLTEKHETSSNVINVIQTDFWNVSPRRTRARLCERVLRLTRAEYPQIMSVQSRETLNFLKVMYFFGWWSIIFQDDIKTWRYAAWNDEILKRFSLHQKKWKTVTMES